MLVYRSTRTAVASSSRVVVVVGKCQTRYIKEAWDGYGRLSRRYSHSATATATKTAARISPNPSPIPIPSSSSSSSSSSTSTSSPTPSLVSTELSSLKSSLFHLLGSSHPSLDAIAKYYFQADGKHLRPMLVLLMSQATNGLGGKEWERLMDEDDVGGGQKVDESLTSIDGVLNDWNPEVMGEERLGDMIFAQPFQPKNRTRISRPLRSSSRPTNNNNNNNNNTSSSSTSSTTILSTQRRLASITEMIHVASLLHDDVIDESPLRRNLPSAPQQFGNKLSILSGDFLLGRASVALARLGNNEVVELLATVIANLVEGEVLQLRSPIAGTTSEGPTEEAFEMYMRKTYLKTASLMAKSSRAAVILGGCGEGENVWVKEAAYAYGRNLGIAFQLIDDMLDFLPPSPTLGKPSLGADLSLGLTTAPSLFAWRTQPLLGPLIARKFSHKGDVELARELVGKTDGLRQTRELAELFANKAGEAISEFPEGEAKDSLMDLTRKVVQRVA